jgi:hypothetical protein
MMRQAIIEVMATAQLKTEPASSLWDSNDHKIMFSAAIDAIEAAGYAVVPVEPTGEQQADGRDALEPYIDTLRQKVDDQWHLARLTYAAMVKAGKV